MRRKADMDKTDDIVGTLPRSGGSECDTGKSAVRHVYARWAPFYNATFGGLVTRYRRHIRGIVDASGSRDVLEVGVGTGGSLRHYPKGTKVVGIDMCAEMLEKAQVVVADGVEADVDLRLGDGEKLAFPDASFDLVVMLFVVSVTPNPHALLDEVARVLRPGGRVLIINHFAGVRGITWVERLLAPMADHVGFHSELPLDAVTQHPAFNKLRTTSLWPIGFFQLVTLEVKAVAHV